MPGGDELPSIESDILEGIHGAESNADQLGRFGEALGGDVGGPLGLWNTARTLGGEIGRWLGKRIDDGYAKFPHPKRDYGDFGDRNVVNETVVKKTR
jgi:hypothetical protein